jgi:hypothetical protein
MAGGRTTTAMDSYLKIIFMLATPRMMLMRGCLVPCRATSRYVANPISAPFKITITASWTGSAWTRKLLTILVHFLQAQSTLQPLLADFHPLLCFTKVLTSPPGHLRLLRPLPLPLAHSPHLRNRESVHVRRPLLMKTELRLKSLPPLQARNMLKRWQSMRNGWLS